MVLKSNLVENADVVFRKKAMEKGLKKHHFVIICLTNLVVVCLTNLVVFLSLTHLVVSFIFDQPGGFFYI